MLFIFLSPSHSLRVHLPPLSWYFTAFSEGIQNSYIMLHIFRDNIRILFGLCNITVKSEDEYWRHHMQSFQTIAVMTRIMQTRKERWQCWEWKYGSVWITKRSYFFSPYVTYLYHENVFSASIWNNNERHLQSHTTSSPVCQQGKCAHRFMRQYMTSST